MARLFSAAFLMIFMTVTSAFAQDDIAWVQIEAHPSLATAQDRARSYAATVQDVNGFALGSGWYALALGPYAREDADQVLRVYRAEGTIPRDSFIAFSSSYRQQFWPVGANLLNLPAVTAPAQSEEVATATQPAVQPEPQVTPADESPREARDSEAQLSRSEREALQVALKWAGFYDSSIDGAFGRGTRASMASWQQANGYEPTGILTTLQRAALIGQYNAVLNGLDLKRVRDEEAGIEMLMPTAAVKFEKYEPPFAHYTATGDVNATVLLISQEGDQNTLFGLYDIMQTLAIVPEDGPRTRGGDEFMLVGLGADFISHTQASLKNGEIKGFTLIWPAGDEERRTRLLGEMQSSFTRLDGTIDPAMLSGDGQSIDLVAGLEIRKPKMSRSGFFIDAKGTVVTTAEAVQNCGRITLDDTTEADLVSSDATLGVAVLRPKDPLAPISVASFQQSTPRLQSEIAVSGYSYGGVLSAPTLTFGTLSDVNGLNGEAGLKRLALNALPGDVGGPVFDAGGAVLGMLLPATDGARQLPADVSFAADGSAIRAMLTKLGLSTVSTEALTQIAPEELTDRASGMTVLVSCWD